MDKETKLTVALLKEKIEKLTGKKITLTEGTWAMPEGDKFVEGQKILKQLNKIQKVAYHVFGDDEFMDGMDAAIGRASFLLEVVRRKILKSSIPEIKQESIPVEKSIDIKQNTELINTPESKFMHVFSNEKDKSDAMNRKWARKSVEQFGKDITGYGK